MGIPPRSDARCRACGSLERHRLLAVALGSQDLVRRGESVLHFAPEQPVYELLERISPGMVTTADIDERRAQLKLDVESIAVADGKFDVVVCSHVLEHVDDRRALSEIARVLRPGGRLLAGVPIVEGWDETHESPEIIAGDERFLEFGQNDHLRIYGRDFRTRIAEAGLELSEFVGTPAQCRTYGLVRGERLFIGTKPA